MSQGTRILIVEDDSSSAHLLAAALSRKGYELMIVPDGMAALDVLELFHPDLILLDMRLPILDGWGFLEQYAKQSSSRIPVIAVSAIDISPKSLEGVAAFLQKPFSLPTLLDVVARTLAPESPNPG